MDTSAHGLWHNVAILALDEGGNQKTIQTDHTLIASDLDQYLKYLPEGYRVTEIVGGFDGETWEDSIPVYDVYYDLEDRGEDRGSPAHIKPINPQDVGKIKSKERIFGRSSRWHYTSIDNLFHNFCKTQPQIGNDSTTSYNTCYSQAGTTWSISTGVRSQQGATWEGTRTLNLATGFAGGAPYNANYKGVREGREDQAAEHGVGRTGKAPATVPTPMVEAMRAETRLSLETLAVQQRLLDDLCIGDVVRYKYDHFGVLNDLKEDERHSREEMRKWRLARRDSKEIEEREREQLLLEELERERDLEYDLIWLEIRASHKRNKRNRTEENMEMPPPSLPFWRRSSSQRQRPYTLDISMEETREQLLGHSGTGSTIEGSTAELDEDDSNEPI